ncbi:MAG: holo-ACP synthase [Sedimentisphaerales bacterium]|nr:holo-ACP synthase [Sedimentisphaerales bacterium]
MPVRPPDKKATCMKGTPNRIAHGIDLVDFARIESMLREHGSRFRDRVFTSREQADAEKRKNHIELLAGRFAAKEAVMKLVGTGWRSGVSWTDIEVTNGPLGEPQLALSGEVKRLAEQLGFIDVAISITHTADFAIASAVALRNEDE